MISKEDWKSAFDEMIAEGRRRLEPPTVEEVEKLFNGKLGEAEADRVRNLLTYYPEMARAMTMPFPEDAEGAMTDEEIAAGLADIRRKVQLPPSPAARVPRRRRIPSRTLAMAASVAVAVGLGGVAVWRLQRAQPAGVIKVLYADGERGGVHRGPQEQPPIELETKTDYILKPVFRPSHAYREYRLELFDLNAATARPVWHRSGVERQADGSYQVELSTEDFPPGRYRLVLYGVDDAPVPLAVYTIRLYEP
jgi:hypothetical protein